MHRQILKRKDKRYRDRSIVIDKKMLDKDKERNKLTNEQVQTGKKGNDEEKRN